jgi:uncharacterized protein (TIGR04255 family)
MGTKLANAPVYFTLAQVVFNSIASLDSYAPAIQDRLRKKGFPDYKNVITGTFSLMPPTPEAVPQMASQTVMQHHFFDMGLTAGYVVESNSLAYMTTQYDVFETFLDRLLDGVAVLSDVFGGLSFIDRIGFRMLDAVIPDQGKSLKDYLDPSVIGIAHKVGDGKGLAFSESRIIFERTQAIARCFIQEGLIGFPPDLTGGNGLRLADRFQGNKGRYAILDSDAFIAERKEFNLDALKEDIIQIKDAVSTIFRATVTSDALDSWR